MDRKKFLKNSFLGLGAIVALPTAISSCSKDNDAVTTPANSGSNNSNDCAISPTETVGPFPILTPAQYVRPVLLATE
ncbi:hypothetical protein [Flavobacterium sp. CF136]|uniref:hypothetical protein n=1 Tax=Flavobacterium sp. (strain CF136) TaxID=1144313 RepID=UPI0002715AD1|nr:hypothetical protein [Flavobacterium sp. CF136]EJL65280.1 hypothetical protein PMI10_01473 [Flavobacterium sp. CF136]